MAEERIETIIKEIQYWKKSHLLPREYCDFLLALYTQGDEEAGSLEMEPRVAGKRLSAVLTGSTLFLLPLSFLVIYFTEIDPLLQTGLLSTFAIFTFFYGRFLKKRNNFQFHIPVIVGFLILLLLSVSMFHTFYTNNKIIYLLLLANSLVWVGTGFRLKLYYLIAAGVIGLILTIILTVLEVFT